MEHHRHLEFGVHLLKSRYENQSQDIWIRILAAVKPVINEEEPRRPGVILFILPPSGVHQLVSDTATTISNCLGGATYRNWTAEQMEDLGITVLNNYIDLHLKTGNGRVVVFENIGEIKSPDNLNLLHTLCDNDSSKYKRACFILTVTLQESEFQQELSPEDNIRTYLNAKWSYISHDRRAALIARISAVTLVAKEDVANSNVTLIDPVPQNFINSKPPPAIQETKGFISRFFQPFMNSNPSPVIPIRPTRSPLDDKVLKWQEKYHMLPVDSGPDIIKNFLTSISRGRGNRPCPHLLFIISTTNAKSGSFTDEILNEATYLCNPLNFTNLELTSLAKTMDDSVKNKKTVIIRQNIVEEEYPGKLSLLWYFCREESKFTNSFWIFNMVINSKTTENSYHHMAKSSLTNIFQPVIQGDSDTQNFVNHLTKSLVFVN